MSAEERTRTVSFPLLTAGIACLAVAAWAVLGGPTLIDAQTVAAVLGIFAVAVAGVMLIKPRTSRDAHRPTAPETSPDDR
ncbi:hypothetical protein GCM10027289_10780 [Tsukamurella serpentis]